MWRRDQLEEAERRIRSLGLVQNGAANVWMATRLEDGPLTDAEVEIAFALDDIALAEAAVALVLRDIHATTDLRPLVRVHDEEGCLRIRWYDNQKSLDPWQGPWDRVNAIVSVADYLQEEVMGDECVWPVCPDHDVGLHPTVADGDSVWFCRARRHVIAAIGELR